MIWVVLYKIFIRFIVFLALTRSLDEHHYIIPSYDCSISNWFVFHPSDHTEFFWIQSSYRSSHVFNSTSSDILQYLNIPISTFSARQSAATTAKWSAPLTTSRTHDSISASGGYSSSSRFFWMTSSTFQLTLGTSIAVPYHYYRV